jgi:hypothetical protein
MNNENLEFLQSSLKYLGFGEKLLLNQQLTEQVAAEPKEFKLETAAFFDEDHKMEVTLHFRRSDQLDMYFFNKYDARLSSGEDTEPERAQTFYINKGWGITLREAYNLLQGRAVNKDLVSMEGQKYNAWIQLNMEEKDQHNNYKVKQFRAQYGYDLEKTLENYPIRELKNAMLKANLIRALRKGNRHPVSFDKSGKIEKMFIEANPQYKTINIQSAVNRAARKGPLKQDPATAGRPGELPGTRPGGKNREDWEEPENEDPEEVKEEEAVEAEVSGSKQPARRKAHK